MKNLTYEPDNWGHFWQMPYEGFKFKKFGLKIETSDIEGLYDCLFATTSVTTTRDEITFNGSPIEDVISYDETAGEVHYYERHWSSKDYVPDGDDPTGYRTARSKGTVKVVQKAEAPVSKDLNKDPAGQCGIDPAYAPWYPYMTPGFCETAQQVEFDFCGFEEVSWVGAGSIEKTSKAVMCDALKVDGIISTPGWTLVKVREEQDSLILSFVALSPSTAGEIYLASGAELDSLRLRGFGQIAPGYMHIYKIVKMARANYSAVCPDPSHLNITDDPTNWRPGTEVDIRPGNPLYWPGVDPVTLKVMQKLC